MINVSLSEENWLACRGQRIVAATILAARSLALPKAHRGARCVPLLSLGSPSLDISFVYSLNLGQVSNELTSVALKSILTLEDFE